MVPLAERLAPFCEVFAPDLPGYGKSYKPWPILTVPELADALVVWMDAERLARVHLLANSFGCQIVADLAARHPARVDRLVLQGPTTDPDARTKWQQFVRLGRNSRHEPKGLGWITFADYAAAGIRRAWATFDLVVRDRIEAKLPQVQAPTLVVRGELDPLVPQVWAERVTALLPRGELVVMPGLPHTINFGAPEALVRVVRPFLGL
jgi:2-hydroxy-6-oxonona-2,4-dienedioate hydrolase